MIIWNNSSIIDMKQFLSGIGQAAEGVVYITVKEKGNIRWMNGGWLITDTLVVVPRFTVGNIIDTSGSKENWAITCRTSSQVPEEVDAELVSAPSPEARHPVLLRLRRPLPNRPLKLSTSKPKENGQVFLLHHPHGLPDLKLSIGTLLQIADQTLRYDAPTEPGSGGGAVCNENGELIGMHVAGWDHKNKIAANEGVSLDLILDVLRSSQEWGEIARYHNLADLSAARKELEKLVENPKPAGPDQRLLYAAVHWSFDPKTIPQDQLDQLMPLVINPSAPLWVLRSDERQRLLSGGSLDTLRAARGADPASDIQQRVFDSILKGPPYFLEQIQDDELPYWLQIVRWFSELIPELPTPQEINHVLEQRRVRGRLQAIVGPKFRGRKKELSKMKDWREDPQAGPMVVTGIGGVGKSALVAQFALKLPTEWLLFWLDFDRADIAPDDAVSVLNLLANQAAVQIDSFPPLKMDEGSWESEAQSFGKALAATDAPVQLVLDSFEVAQYIPQYQEIWRLLELILVQLPDLRILISGRAPVENLSLAGRPATSLNLTGLSRQVAKDWLLDANITDDTVLNSVLNIANGVPLVIMLAVQFLELGGSVTELPEKLPGEVINGFLYQRILDRVMDPDLKPIARDVLVLRRLTADMLPAIASDSIRATANLSAQTDGNKTPDINDLFSRLGREMALVSGSHEAATRSQVPVTIQSASGDVLRLRPEVRVATLKLLEQENLAHVQEIDRRAASWYAGQDLSDPVNTAELVYHRLRLKDLQGAKSVWMDACAPLLVNAEDELPVDAKAERRWLRNQTGKLLAPEGEENLAAWEAEAALRIRTSIGRGLTRAVPSILGERKERSAEGPLVFFDAWQLWQNGEIAGARALLDKTLEEDSPAAMDRAVLAAFLAAQDKDHSTADRLLQPLTKEERWRGSVVEKYAVLAVQAARVLLTVDLDAELELYSLIANNPSRALNSLSNKIKTFLSPHDVILQPLAQVLGSKSTLEGMGMKEPISIPEDPQALPQFAGQIDRVRREALVSPANDFLSVCAPYDEDVWQAKGKIAGKRKKPVEYGMALAKYLAGLGWKRWRLVTTSLFLSKACDQARPFPSVQKTSYFSTSGTLAILGSSTDMSLRLMFHDWCLDDILKFARDGVIYSKWTALSIERLTAEMVVSNFYSKFGMTAPLAKIIKAGSFPESGEWRTLLPKGFLLNPDPKWLNSLFLYFISPNPLEALLQNFISPADSAYK